MSAARLLLVSFVCTLIAACIPLPPNMGSWPGKGPLDYAIRDGNTLAVKDLLNVGVNPNALNSRVISPLMRATQMGRVDYMTYLLEAGADVNAVSATLDPSASVGVQSVPLCQALKDDNVEVVKLLDQHGAKWHFANGQPVSGCWFNSTSRDLPSLKYMVERNVDFRSGVWAGGSAVNQFVSTTGGMPASEAKQILRLLKKTGQNLNAAGSTVAGGVKVAPLHIAAQNKPEMMKALLDLGAVTNTKNSLGETPLHLAARYNCADCVVQLIEAGADLYARDAKGLPPIAEAMRGGEVLTLLASAGGLSALSQSERRRIIASHDYVGPSIKDFVLNYTLTTRPYKNYVASMSKDLLPQKAVRLSAKQRMAREKKRAAKQLEKERQAKIAKRRAEEERQRKLAVQQKKQRAAEQAVRKVWQNSKDFNQVLDGVAEASANCSAHRKLVSEVEDVKCSFKDKYRAYHESDACMSLQEDVLSSVRRYKRDVCNEYDRAKKKTLAIFKDPQKKTAASNEISRRAKNFNSSPQRLISHYDVPLRDMERIVEQDRRAENEAQKRQEREAWARVAKAASTWDTQSHVREQFDSVYKTTNKILYSQSASKASSASLDQKLASTQRYLASNPIKTVSTKPAAITKEEALRRSKAACDTKGGRFDAARNNCTIVTTRQTAIVQQLATNTVGGSSGTANGYSANGGAPGTSNASSGRTSYSDSGSGAAGSRSNTSGRSGRSKGSSQAEDNQWKIRSVDCGHTNFDKTMPKPGRVCMNAAPPTWEMIWHYKPFFDGIHLVNLKLENTSDVPLEFVMNGRVSGDKEQRNFSWSVIVPANSSRTKSDGMDLPEVPHMISILKMKWRQLK
jgi:hypothetical protein